MSASRIQRYLIGEVLSPTLLCIVIFTLVMVMGRAVKLVDLVVNKGVSPLDILYLLATLLPTFFSISLPLAFLMGIMIGFGRLSADSEAVALKAAGVGLARMAAPVFVLAALFTLLTAAANLWAKPWGYGAFAAKSFEIARQKVTAGMQPRVFVDQFDGLVLYADGIDDRQAQLSGLFIVEKKPESTAWVFADSGRIVSDAEARTVTIRLRDGVIHRQERDKPDDVQLIRFRNYDVQPQIGTMSAPAARAAKPKELPTAQLWSNAAVRSELQAELHLRLASPLAPLLFVLFGLPFSMQSHRTGRSGGFVMGLAIFLGYYFMLSTGFTLTKDAAISPWLTIWLPHLLAAVAGTLFLHRAAQERPNPIAAWIDQAVYTLQAKVRKHDDA